MTLSRKLQSRGVKAGIWFDKVQDVQSVRDLVAQLRPKTGEHALIRIGPVGDGGYLLPDDLEGIGACISPGVSFECGFDLEMADRGMEVHMADASVAAPPVTHDRFHFSPLFLDAYSSGTTVTLAEYVAPIAPGEDLLLQMDIDSAEWRVLNATPSEVLARFRIIVLETHDLVNLFTRFGFREINAVFQKLLLTHEVVHLHPNNIAAPVAFDGLSIPNLIEFTFHRKDRAQFVDRAISYPHPLDSPNVDDRADLVLPKCWWPEAA